MDSLENKNKRAEFQKQAIIKLLGYISMLAEISGCILKRQYKQISIQVAESINLITAWKKSEARVIVRKDFRNNVNNIRN